MSKEARDVLEEQIQLTQARRTYYAERVERFDRNLKKANEELIKAAKNVERVIDEYERSPKVVAECDKKLSELLKQRAAIKVQPAIKKLANLQAEIAELMVELEGVDLSELGVYEEEPTQDSSMEYTGGEDDVEIE
jgi:chromosome segregation ATPase